MPLFPVDPSAPASKSNTPHMEEEKTEPTGNIVYDYRVEMFESLNFSSGEAHLLATQGFEHTWVADKTGKSRCWSTPVYWGHVKQLMDKGASHGEILAMYV